MKQSLRELGSESERTKKGWVFLCLHRRNMHKAKSEYRINISEDTIVKIPLA